MLKKTYYFVICLLPGFVVASLIVGGIFVKLGWVPEAASNRVAGLLTPLPAALIFYAFFLYDSRSDEQKKAARLEARRQRSRYREDL